MSIFTKTLVAAGLTLALAGGAYASDASEWKINAGQGYAVDMAGHTLIIENMSAPTKKMMARAKVVPRGTVFFMHDGKLMMAFDPSVAGATK
jgi:hypothetical protein